MPVIHENYDIVVVGAGHAGCEAALASARMGLNTILFTVSMDSIAMMPCNPNVGGSSKGHLVRELDALGGEMGKNIDKTYIQSKMLNASKGPAVHSLRAQADKGNYSRTMKYTLENTDNLVLRQAEVSELIIENNVVKGVKTVSGGAYTAKAVILCTGTYLKARCIYGDVVNPTGPNGLMAANHLSDSMEKAGIGIRRFKTGTPARIDKRTIDFSQMEEQRGDEKIVPFSFTNTEEDIKREQLSCWLCYTNEETHEIIRENIDRSPLFSGFIEGTGPRYCPSIEDKIMKFPDKTRHQIFIEPEGEFTNEMYMGGMSSSLPEDVQYEMIHSMKGLENARIIRNAYAIEYDCISATNLKHTLEFKDIEGLYGAGQLNGSSGYEEAAAQGLMAGINAARKIKGEDPVVLDRSQGYIGVLIDDLVTKETMEPYRMMTSRAEYRLLLRQDNADLRLTDIGHEIGLIDDCRYGKFCHKRDLINSELARLNEKMVGANAAIQEFLTKQNSMPLKTAVSLAELIRRPELSYEIIAPIDEVRPTLPEDVIEQINISIKYEGYIRRQTEQVHQFKKLEKRKIPADINYEDISNLRKEARQKLMAIRPESIGQASRISGVSPADISVLLVYLKTFRLQQSTIKYKREKKMERLNNIAKEIGIELDDTALARFEKYYELLTEWNKVMNLTAITERDDVIIKHFADSLLIAKYKDFGKPLKAIDVGTGAGFPGIPLKIAFPELELTLMDSLAKRLRFLDEVISSLELEKTETVHARAEDGGKNPLYREQYDLAVSRAVANLSALSEFCIPFVRQGGYFVSYKSSGLEDELHAGKKAIRVLGGQVENIFRTTLPETDMERTFVFVKKVSETPAAYPRKAGAAAKKPLC